MMTVLMWRLVCVVLGHDAYVCDEPDCYEYGHRVCRRCGWMTNLVVEA